MALTFDARIFDPRLFDARTFAGDAEVGGGGGGGPAEDLESIPSDPGFSREALDNDGGFG